FLGSAPIAAGVWNLLSSSRPWPSGGPHRRDLASNVLEPNDKVHPTSLDWHLAFQLHTKLDKKRLRSLKVVNHDENVVHPPKCHSPAPLLDRKRPALALYMPHNDWRISGAEGVRCTRGVARFAHSQYGQATAGGRIDQDGRPERRWPSDGYLFGSY